jgi:cell division septum initiation protein DivIVA
METQAHTGREAEGMNEALFFLVALLFVGIMVRENMRLERRVQSLEAEVQATKDQVKSVTQAIMRLSTQITERKQ